MDIETKDGIMLVVTVVGITLEIVLLMWGYFHSKNQKIVKYLSKGGVTQGTLLKREMVDQKFSCRYHYYVEEREYFLNLTLKESPEHITVYYDVHHPEEALSDVGDSFLIKHGYLLMPVILIILLWCISKIIYG